MDSFLTRLDITKTLRMLALLSMCLIIGANFIQPGTGRTALFIAGCIGMLLAPMLENQPFLTALQVIALIGSLSALLPVTEMAKAFLPLVASLAFASYFAFKGELSQYQNIIGTIGITFLGLGYATQHPLIYLLGGLSLLIYSAITYLKGVEIAVYWAILNAFFIFAVLYNVTHFD